MSGTQKEFEFRCIFSENAEAILGYALRRVPFDQASDIVTETFLIFWRRFEDAPKNEDVKPWLYGVARRVIQNQNRSTTRQTRLGHKLHSHLTNISVNFEETTTTAVLVQETLKRLHPDDQELLTLTSFEGFTTREISVALDIPSSTVRTRLRRARIKFAEELSKFDELDESEPPPADMYQ